MTVIVKGRYHKGMKSITAVVDGVVVTSVIGKVTPKETLVSPELPIDDLPFEQNPFNSNLNLVTLDVPSFMKKRTQRIARAKQIEQEGKTKVFFNNLKKVLSN